MYNTERDNAVGGEPRGKWRPGYYMCRCLPAGCRLEVRHNFLLPNIKNRPCQWQVESYPSLCSFHVFSLLTLISSSQERACIYYRMIIIMQRCARARDLKYSPARSFTKKRPVGDEWTEGKDGSFIHTGKEKKWHHRPHQLCESRTQQKRGSLRHAFLYTSIHNISLYYHFVDTIISVYRIFLKKIKVNMCHLDISRGTIHIYK
jgi:hypothetical protein